MGAELADHPTGDLAPEDRRIAVLGGTGFVGRPVCRALIANGYHPVVISRSAPADFTLAPVHRLDLAEASFQQLARILNAERITTVINAAGGMWGLTDEQMVAANLTLVLRVIEAAAAQPWPVRVVQLGSVHEYGLFPVGTPMDEQSQAAPVNAYGDLKRQCTEAVLAAGRQGRVEGISLRIGNVIGAAQPQVSLLGVVAQKLSLASEQGIPAVIKMGWLGALRDFLNLSDAVDAVVISATDPKVTGGLFNIGTGRATSARSTVEMLIEASGVPAELVEAPGGPETTWQQMRIDKARQFLGWSPQGDLSDGIRELWEHHAKSANA